VHIRGWSSDRLLTCLAAAGLGLYSIKLLFEELRERFADEDEDASACELCRRCCRGHKFAPLPVDEDKAVDDAFDDEDLGVELTEAAAAVADPADEPAEALEDVDLEKQETAKAEPLEEVDDGSARTLFAVAFCGRAPALPRRASRVGGGAWCVLNARERTRRCCLDARRGEAPRRVVEARPRTRGDAR